MNVQTNAKFPVYLLFLAAFLVNVSAAVAADSERHQRVDGMDVYLGVMPSQMIMKHPRMHGIVGLPQDQQLTLPDQPHIQGMVPASTHRYHVLVALFDSASGKRITDAKVAATVQAPGLTAKEQKLEPMHTEGALSYGYHFLMLNPGQYKILIDIQRPGAERLTRVNFIYARPRD